MFVLFVCGEKLLLNHKMNKQLPWYVVSSLDSPSASKLSSKSLICPRLRLGQMFTFRTISQPRACITQYNVPRKWFIHKIFYRAVKRRGEYFLLGTNTEGNNCFSICQVSELDMENFSFKCFKLVKNASYL